MTRIMYDAVTAANPPMDGDLYAFYANGLYANETDVKSRHPGKLFVPITVRASTPAQKGWVLDVETGDATAAEAVAWVRAYPGVNTDVTVYCDTSTWPSVRAVFQAAGVTEPSYWVAQYDGDPTIPAGAVAKQYLGDFHGYDKSSVRDFWPGIDAAPAPPVPPAPVPVPVTLLEGDMVIVQYPNTAPGWKGDFLFAGGKLTHILTPACENALISLGVPVKTVTAVAFGALFAQFGG